MMKLTRILAVVLLVGVSGGGCSGPPDFTRVASERTPLIEPFQSYASLDEVRAQLPSYPNVAHTTSSQGRPDERDPRERWDSDELEVDGFVHYGHRGRLVLTLWNNRLGETRFYAEDTESYLAALRGIGLDLALGRELDVRPYTRVSMARDFRNRAYVAWRDTRLDAEFEDWIIRHA
jgi:hypothetical protein